MSEMTGRFLQKRFIMMLSWYEKSKTSAECEIFLHAHFGLLVLCLYPLFFGLENFLRALHPRFNELPARFEAVMNCEFILGVKVSQVCALSAKFVEFGQIEQYVPSLAHF